MVVYGKMLQLTVAAMSVDYKKKHGCDPKYNKAINYMKSWRCICIQHILTGGCAEWKGSYVKIAPFIYDIFLFNSKSCWEKRPGLPLSALAHMILVAPKCKAKKNMLFRYEVSPGMDLMAYLPEKIKLDIEKKKSGDEKWTRLNVILSDADVPGEGEHKIVSFIREHGYHEREYGYQNNQCHAIYFPDSDCGLVAFLTHEVNMFVYSQMKSKRKGGKEGENTTSLFKGVKDEVSSSQLQGQLYRKTEMSALRNIVRSCCGLDKDNVDGERAIDDFLFILNPLGNDYMPPPAYIWQFGSTAYI